MRQHLLQYNCTCLCGLVLWIFQLEGPDDPTARESSWLETCKSLKKGVLAQANVGSLTPVLEFTVVL